MKSDLDLGSLLGTDISAKLTDEVLGSLLLSMENFQNDTTVKGTGNIFNCAISLGDFDFDLNLDLFKFTPSKMDYILLEKIKYLRRLIVEINNILINLIKDLECCTGDDRYNKTVVPIFKWLVEEENGLCGSLLKISKDINKIYLPLKRILCLFRLVPGNPVLGPAGTDFFKYVYPFVDGMEKVLNLLDNGRFLDLLIIPIKDFHDKLVACSSGKDVDFYTGYTSLKDIISSSIYSELTTNLIDSIKIAQGSDVSELDTAPVAPVPPVITYSIERPKLQDYDTFDEFSKALYKWNLGYSDYRKTQEREYDSQYNDYLIQLNKYKQVQFEKTLSLKNDTFENSTFAVELMTDDFKTKHRSICGCLGEIFRLDGLFIPKDYIIRNEDDLYNLIGEVKYKGITVSNYYTKDEKHKIDIINETTLKDVLVEAKATTFAETLKYPMVRNDLLAEINATQTIDDVIKLNTKFTNKLITLKNDYRKRENYLDSLSGAFYSLYQNEVHAIQRKLAQYKNGADTATSYEETKLSSFDYISYPPSSWLSNDKSLDATNASIFGNITYHQFVTEVEKLKTKSAEIKEYEAAIGRNYSSFKIVDNASIECGCDLLCMIVKYIINLIMQIVKLLLKYITQYITNAIMDKELMWWIKFIQAKVQCMVDIINLPKELSRMEKLFNSEIEAAKGSIKKVPESLTSCTTSKSSVIDEINLYPDKAHVDVADIVDITWTPSIYPEIEVTSVDVTPTIDNSFNLITELVTYETDKWKNRTIPNMVLDCKKDFSAKVDWVPTTNSWKAFMNIQMNIDQFNASPDIIITGNEGVTTAEILKASIDSVLFSILSMIIGNENFHFKLEYKATTDFYTDNTSSVCELTSEIFKAGLVTYELKYIDRVWFLIDGEYLKVFDRNQISDMETFLVDTKEQLLNALKDLKKINSGVEIPMATNNKICGGNSLGVTLFEPVFNVPTMMAYPGPVVKTVDPITSEASFSFTPKHFETDVNGVLVEEIFTNNNTPFKISLTNGSGTVFTVIALLDICDPNNIVKTSYDKNIDGVFLNGRYDYIDFGAVGNDRTMVLTETQVIKKLRKYLENIGAISSSSVGPVKGLSDEEVDGLVDNTIEVIKYMDGFNTNQDTSNASAIIENMPDGAMKTNLLKYEALQKIYAGVNTSVETIAKSIENYDVGIINIDVPDNTLTKTVSRLGIPLMVLNEDQNIILTIHQKKLKVININSNFGLDLLLETSEIEYNAGEQLFVEFSTTGFEHTISWTNEKKKSNAASVISTNSLPLKPTQIGSYYKNGIKVALMCGRINDLIFTESSRTKDEWFNNSNTYRPNGTIGYYDFSVFDGYNVYSVPEFFKVTKIGNLATLKGILYESKEYTRAEIMQKIQNNEANELLASDIMIVGEKPITVGGDFIWKNKVYYKNITFGYLDNFFCRNNLAGGSFTISCWLKMKDSVSNGKIDSEKKYIFSDTNNGNFIWWQDGILYIKLHGQPIRSEPVYLLFKKDIYSATPEYVEKWFNHAFRYDKENCIVYYDITCIDQNWTMDTKYPAHILDKISIKIPLQKIPNVGRLLSFSLVSMLARYDMKTLLYVDYFDSEIAALAIWNEFKDKTFMEDTFNYQRKIILNEMGD